MTRLILCAVLLCLTTACSKQNFSADDSNSSNGLAFNDGDINVTCTDVLQTTTIPVKVVLSVDTSGSNVPHTDQQGIARPGNDVNKARRGGAIQNFFNAYKGRSNFAWSLLHFQDATSYSLIGSATSPTFTSSASVMQGGINTFMDIVDRDGTPYMAAIQRIRQTITNDTTRNADTKYAVVFVSDGRPDPYVSTAELVTAVQGVIQLAPGQVTFSTIYYGLPSFEATSRLATMADAGAGAFLDASNGQVPRIEDAITVAGTKCK